MRQTTCLLIVAAFVTSVICEQRKVVCYWQMRIDFSLIDPSICTHVIVAFAQNEANGTVFVSNVHGEKIRNLSTLKLKNPDLKLMISFFSNFREIASNARVEFAENVLNFVEEYELDGADIDWEWPFASDRVNLELMLHEIRILFRPRGLILSAAVGACANLDTSYEPAKLLAEVDFLNVMTYNLHGGTWENRTANPGNYWDTSSRYSVITCLNHWIKKGTPHNKMVVGIPTHSRNFQLDDPEKNGIFELATFKGFGQEGELPSSFSYNVICKNILENGWTRIYSYVDSTGPYAFFGKTWAGYDDVQSIREKALMVKKVNFGGIVFWSLDHDDHSNVCGDGKFPLIKSVWDIIMK